MGCGSDWVRAPVALWEDWEGDRCCVLAPVLSVLSFLWVRLLNLPWVLILAGVLSVPGVWFLIIISRPLHLLLVELVLQGCDRCGGPLLCQSLRLLGLLPLCLVLRCPRVIGHGPGLLDDQGILVALPQGVCCNATEDAFPYQAAVLPYPERGSEAVHR